MASCAAAVPASKAHEINAIVRIILVPFVHDIGTKAPKAKGNCPLLHKNFIVNGTVSLLRQSGWWATSRHGARFGPQDRGHWAMELKLHLGAHRCATTTFQTYLWANRATLVRRGLTSWTPKRTRDGLMRGMLRHPTHISLEGERQALRSTGRMRIEIDRLAREGQSHLLISDAGMIGTVRDNVAEARLYPLLGERLSRFQAPFAGYPLQIGLSVRSYEDYWASSLGMLLARGMPKPSADLLDFLTTQPRRWRTMVRDIAAVFPQAEIIVWPFERFADRPADVLDMFNPGASRGLSYDGTRHSRSGDVARLNEILIQRGETRFDAAPRDGGDRWMPFDEDQARVLRAEYRRDIAWLKGGAEGLATYIDGRQTPAHSPDGAQTITQVAASGVAPERGQDDGIEEGLGGTRAI